MNKKLLEGTFMYDRMGLVMVYSALCLGKIYFQVHFNYVLQSLFLMAINYILIYPFFKDPLYLLKDKVLLYFVVLSSGEFIIIFYEDLVFLKLGILCYLSSKFVLLLILKNKLQDFRLLTAKDFCKILGPQLISFAMAYLIYNDANVDFSLSILIIIYAVVEALIFSYIFYFKNYDGVNIVRIGLVFISLHDIYGGYNFFNHNIDKYFIVSFLLISTGKFFLGLGLWKSHIYKNLLNLTL
jgi:hypothetical protein